MGKWKNLQGCYHLWENSFNPKPQKAIWPRSTRWPFLCAHQMSGMLLNNRSWRQLLDMLQHLVLIKCIHPAYEDFELFPTPWHRRVCKEKASSFSAIDPIFIHSYIPSFPMFNFPIKPRFESSYHANLVCLPLWQFPKIKSYQPFSFAFLMAQK